MSAERKTRNRLMESSCKMRKLRPTVGEKVVQGHAYYVCHRTETEIWIFRMAE